MLYLNGLALFYNLSWQFGYFGNSAKTCRIMLPVKIAALKKKIKDVMSQFY